VKRAATQMTGTSAAR